jgi:hypothetical protein
MKKNPLNSHLIKNKFESPSVKMTSQKLMVARIKKEANNLNESYHIAKFMKSLI